jgi:hypothetical protein
MYIYINSYRLKIPIKLFLYFKNVTKIETFGLLQEYQCFGEIYCFHLHGIRMCHAAEILLIWVRQKGPGPCANR